MPTYDYVCHTCDHAFELFQQMSARVKRTCPECGEKTLERLIGTGAGVLFKGSGFYETDYRSNEYRKRAEADTKPADGDKSSKTSTDTSSDTTSSSTSSDAGKTSSDGGASTTSAKKKASTDAA